MMIGELCEHGRHAWKGSAKKGSSLASGDSFWRARDQVTDVVGPCGDAILDARGTAGAA